MLANSQELRRQQRENNLAITVSKQSPLLSPMMEARAQWETELDEAIEAGRSVTPFALVAWELLFAWGSKEVQSHAELENAAQLAQDMLSLSGRGESVHRFYALKLPAQNGQKESSDPEEETPGMIFIVRFKNTGRAEEATKMLRKLDAKDALAHCGLALRGDRAPRSGMEKALQKYLDRQR